MDSIELGAYQQILIAGQFAVAGEHLRRVTDVPANLRTIRE
jgi:hypothetical protein